MVFMKGFLKLVGYLLEQITNDFELDVFQMDPKQLPENDQELELFMQMNYKPADRLRSQRLHTQGER